MAAREQLTQHGREQKLVDICFQIMMLVTDPQYQKHFGKMTMDQKAAWVRDQLDGCGFKTTPVGASWGMLQEI